MSGTPYIRFFGDDWLAGTQELTLEERGALVTIVALTASTGQPVEYDLNRLARRLGTTRRKAERVISSLVALGKISIEHGAVHNQRALKEVEISQNFSKKQSENARARWGNSTGKSNEINENGMPRESHGICQPEPEPNIPPYPPKGGRRIGVPGSVQTLLGVVK